MCIKIRGDFFWGKSYHIQQMQGTELKNRGEQPYLGGKTDAKERCDGTLFGMNMYFFSPSYYGLHVGLLEALEDSIMCFIQDV